MPRTRHLRRMASPSPPLQTSYFPLLHNFCMVLVDLDQSEQQCEEYFYHHKKKHWNCFGSYLALCRWVYWNRRLASARDHQYPHFHLFVGCHPRGIDPAVAHAQEKYERVSWSRSRSSCPHHDHEDYLRGANGS